MFVFRLLLCASIVFGSCLADIPSDDIKFNIFDEQSNSFESFINESLQSTKNFFATKEIESASDAAITITPIIRQYANLVPVFQNLLSEEWNESFSNMVARETRREIIIDRVVWMESTMKTIQDKMRLLNDTNPERTRKATASMFHTDFDIMINYFSHQNSMFKKYPLLGAAPLIELALVVSAFDPIAKKLIPEEAESPEITCKIRDTLHDYFPRAVDARLDKLSTTTKLDSIAFRSAVELAKVLPYSSNGYNDGNMLKCVKGIFSL